jgi:hypothetical protein
VEWIDPSAAAHRMQPAYAIRVFDALNDDHPAGPAIRSHDGIELLPDESPSVISAE